MWSTEPLRYQVLPGLSRNSNFKKNKNATDFTDYTDFFKDFSSVQSVESVALFAIYMSKLVSIAPVILAAGDSTRMGHPKALLPLGGDIFINRILKTLREVGLPDAIVVLGKSAAIIKSHIGDLNANILINPDPDRGQLSSIQLALMHTKPDVAAAMIWPVDMPAVPADVVRHLVELFINSGALISFPIYGGKRGHPAVFHRSLFQEFMDAPLSEGPKNILLRHQQETSDFEVQISAAVKDIDTPTDYRDLTGETLDSALRK
jgi:molybdenum cofactor cytidylyltransferase